MARQKGIIKLKGSIGDISFYKTQDGFLAREKSGVDAERIANDPAFLRTRENGEEFKSTAAAGKMLRDAIRPLLMNSADNRAVSRLVKLMTSIKNMDTTSVRGKRNVGAAIGSASAKALLKGFDFNIRSGLGTVLFKPYSVTPGTGEIKIPSLVPINDIISPPGSTHVSIKGSRARIDFVSGRAEVHESNVVSLPINGLATSVVLTPAGVPSGTGTDIFLLQIEFFQEVNGVQYTLNNGTFNALAIIEVL